MIKFKQKEFKEYDAMRFLYQEMIKNAQGDKRRIPTIIDSSALLPILKGNNVVIERFVISTSLFGKETYRMYLKIGAKAKLPDEVRLPSSSYSKKLGDVRVNFRNGLFRAKSFSNKNKNKGGNQDGGEKPMISTEFSPFITIEHEVKELLGDAIKYDKRDRSLVLEFSSVSDAIRALDILPFGIDYKLYLLNA